MSLASSLCSRLTLGRLALAAAAFVFATGFTECEYFSQVTVPAHDTGKPTVYNGLWKNGAFTELRADGDAIDYQIQPGESIAIIAAGTDPGGVSKVTIATGWTQTCCYSNGVCSTSQPVSSKIVETQPGSVGATVSNGVWAYTGVTAPSCGAAATSQSFDFSWFTTVEDFHGNQKSVPGGTVSYQIP